MMCFEPTSSPGLSSFSKSGSRSTLASASKDGRGRRYLFGHDHQRNDPESRAGRRSPIGPLAIRGTILLTREDRRITGLISRRLVAVSSALDQ